MNRRGTPPPPTKSSLFFELHVDGSCEYDEAPQPYDEAPQQYDEAAQEKRTLSTLLATTILMALSIVLCTTSDKDQETAGTCLSAEWG